MVNAFRATAGVFLLSGVLTLAGGCGSTNVSESEEVRIGRQTAAAIERQYRTYSDPAVSRIGARLAAASERPNLPWTFKVVDTPEVNAISLPGGPIYIYEGLLLRIAGDEDMLAGVLAHEVGHVEKRHAARQMERTQLYGLGAAVLEQAAGGDVGAAGRVAANLQLLSYSRRQEYDSDDVAIRLMRRTGHNPQGLVRLLQLLDRLGGGAQSVNWLRTHPSSKARIDRVQERIRSGA